VAAAVAGLLTWRSRLHPSALLLGGAALFVVASALAG
jgi:hypothetical protein